MAQEPKLVCADCQKDYDRDIVRLTDELRTENPTWSHVRACSRAYVEYGKGRRPVDRAGRIVSLDNS